MQILESFLPAFWSTSFFNRRFNACTRFPSIEIVNAQLIVITQAFGQGLFELGIEGTEPFYIFKRREVNQFSVLRF